MKYKTIIFDMDGTILNTLDDLADSMNYSLEKNGLSQRSVDEVRLFVGNGVRKLIERACPKDSERVIIDKVEKDFLEYYSLHCADKTKPYDGIIELLIMLRNRGLKTAVISNKVDFAVKELCNRYFYGLFDVAVGQRHGMRQKPYADSVFEVIKQLKCEDSTSVFIGDSDVDYNTAKNAGIDSIMVDWGFRDRSFLKSIGAECIVSNINELEKLLIQ